MDEEKHSPHNSGPQLLFHCRPPLLIEDILNNFVSVLGPVHFKLRSLKTVGRASGRSETIHDGTKKTGTTVQLNFYMFSNNVIYMLVLIRS